MRKVLLLITLFIIIVTGCKKNNSDDSSDGFIPEPTIQERFQEIAKKYKVNIDDVIFYSATESENNTDLVGLKNEKFWLRRCDPTTKEVILSIDGKEKLDTVITYDKPYVGKVKDTITFIGPYGIDSNNFNSILLLRSRTKKGDQLINLCFCQDGFITKESDKVFDHDKNFNTKIFTQCRHWLDDNWVVKSNFAEDASYEGQYIYLDFYTSEGNLLSSQKFKVGWSPNMYNLNCMTPINMTDFILYYEKYSHYYYERISSGKVKWSENIDICKSNEKINSITNNLIDNITYQSIYNITLLDGTKINKTVNINTNTGEYNIL